MAGLRAWLLQRLSAMYMGIYLLFFIFYLLIDTPRNYTEWRGMIATPWVALSMMLFFVSLLIHAWVGIRDVIIDYVHNPALRLFKLSMTGLALMVCGLWVLDILLAVMK